MNLDACQLADIHDRVAKAAVAGRIFAITESGAITFADVEDAAKQFTASLASFPHLPHRRIALTGDLGPCAFAALWLAGLRLGLTCLFIPAPANTDMAATWCQKNRVDLVFLPNGPTGTIAFGPQGLCNLPKAQDAQVLPNDSGSGAAVFFTSGSTGTPKGVQLGANGIARHLELYTRLFSYHQPGAIIMNGLPLHHSDGSFHGPMMALWSGAAWLRPPAFSLQRISAWAEMARHHQATHLIANPSLLDMLLRSHPGDGPLHFGPVKSVISSAEVLTADLWQRCQTRLQAGVINIYGMSETTNGGFFALPTDSPSSFGTVGRAHDIDFEIRDAAGNTCPDGVPGRLFLRGASLFQGYEQDGVTIYQRGPQDWFDTCDRAQQDAGGNLSILGRLDKQINLAGYLISPSQIAKALQDLGFCTDVRVEVLDESPNRLVPVAFVSTPYARPVADVFARLPVEERPRYIVQVDGRAPNDLSLDDCAVLFARHRDRPAAGHNIAQTILALAARAFRCTPADLDLNATQDKTPGWDSFAFVELIMEAEAAYDLTFSVNELSCIYRLGDLVTLCRQAASARL